MENIEKIKNKKYIFAEDALLEMIELLGMDKAYASVDWKYWEEIDHVDSSVISFYFKIAEPVFISVGTTKLEVNTHSYLNSGESGIIDFYNTGGISSGLTIIYSGDCIVKGDVEITQLIVEKPKNPRMDRNDYGLYGGYYNHVEIYTGHPVKQVLSNGEECLMASFDDFIFLEGVNINHPSMKGAKGDNIIWNHAVLVRHTATIRDDSDCDLYEFNIYIIPQQNWKEGQVSRIVKVERNKLDGL